MPRGCSCCQVPTAREALVQDTDPAFHTCILQCMQLSSAGDGSYSRFDVINNTTTNTSSEARSVNMSAFEPH